MPPIWELIADREATATATAERLREQITTLTEQLRATEDELAELAVTRKTLTRLTGGPEPSPPADASPAYQQILAVFTTATGPMRARDVCLALGLDVTPKHTEGLRAKLKRLVARGVLAESDPGLFTLVPTPE